MNTISTLFNGPLAEQIGWTLFHSLWQGLIIAGIAIIALRFVPNKFSNVRYAVSGSALLLIFLSAVGTFLYLRSIAVPVSELPAAHTIIFHPAVAEPVELTIVEHIQHFVQDNKSMIVLAWILGAAGFSVRLLGGWLYTTTLRAGSTILYDDWSLRLKELANRTGVSKLVQLAESGALDSPVVIGYLKPVIIVPVGMFSGLTPDEVETILLHELMHIKRNDYIVNVIQSVIESILFFNPFVWILSAIIRREREHCCDDGVVAYHGNAMAYAYALTRLEEKRLGGHSLALSAIGNKYELLNRIKRIMEKSVKKYSGVDRLVPIALLLMGIVLASFLTIGVTKNEPQEVPNLEDQAMIPVALDSPKKKKNEAYYYRKSETVIDENGEPHEVITEEYTGDSALFPMMAFDFGLDSSLHVDFPGAFDMGLVVDPMPAVPMMLNFEPLLDMSIGNLDPALNMSMRRLDPMNFPNASWKQLDPGDSTRFKNWAEFNKEFQKRFKERFKSFYDDHQEEFQAMMEEMATKFNASDWSRHEGFDEEMQRHAEHLQQELEEMQKSQGREIRERHRLVEERMQVEMKRVEESMRRVNEEMEAMEKNMAAFEKDLKQELVKDGYLKEGEKIETINWTGNDDLLINGKKVKHTDAKRYKTLKEKYFKEGSGEFHYKN